MHFSSSGICEIPLQGMDMYQSQTDKGMTFFFRVITRDPEDETDPERVQWLKVMLWVPTNEVEDWKKKLTPGAILVTTDATNNGRLTGPDKQYLQNLLVLKRYKTKVLTKGISLVDKGD